jgi:hypothetical protein
MDSHPAVRAGVVLLCTWRPAQGTPGSELASARGGDAAGETYPGQVLDLSSIDLEEIANALADQTDYEHRWLINPDTGEIAFWTADTGIDGQAPVDLDELDLVVIDPLPSWVWYQDMADFADGITDERAGRRLARAIQGKGAFRRFKDELHEEYPDLQSGQRRAVTGASSRWRQPKGSQEWVRGPRESPTVETNQRKLFREY